MTGASLNLLGVLEPYVGKSGVPSHVFLCPTANSDPRSNPFRVSDTNALNYIGNGVVLSRKASTIKNPSGVVFL